MIISRRIPKPAALFVPAIIMLLVLLSACGTPGIEVTAPTPTLPPPSPSPTPTPTPTVESPLATPTFESPLPTPTMVSPIVTPEPPEAMTGPETTTWIADGVIGANEYDRTADFAFLRLWWRHDETYLYIAMEGDTTGWVSIGIDPQDGMQGANYLFGYVTDGEALLWDAYGTAPRGAAHPPDEDLGGTNDIVAFAGVEEQGVTRFEIQIPLDSGDPYDRPLDPGKTYPIIVAIGAQDEYNAYHTNYARGELVLD